jgi:hypothetical protein
VYQYIYYNGTNTCLIMCVAKYSIVFQNISPFLYVDVL